MRISKVTSCIKPQNGSSGNFSDEIIQIFQKNIKKHIQKFDYNQKVTRILYDYGAVAVDFPAELIVAIEPSVKKTII